VKKRLKNLFRYVLQGTEPLSRIIEEQTSGCDGEENVSSGNLL
jgi:hypothetical protein